MLFSLFTSCNVEVFFVRRFEGFLLGSFVFDPCTVFLMTLWRVIRSAVTFLTSSLAGHVCSSVTFSSWSPPPPPFWFHHHCHGPIPFLLLLRCFKGSDFQCIKLMQKKSVAFTTESFLWKPSLLRDGENLNV